jgi:hypothetical protein
VSNAVSSDLHPVIELQGASGPNQGALISPSNGIGVTFAGASFGLAIDASGNLWVADYDGNALSQIFGVASPVQTPLIGPAKPI